MPRKYNRQTKKASWTAEELKLAVAAIKTGRSIRAVSKCFNIPRSTLQKRIKTNNSSAPSLGRPSIFSKTQEKELTDHVIHLSKLFYGITREEIKKCAYQYSEQNKIKCPVNIEKQAAGDDWLNGFLRRNPSVSLRKPEATSVNRITAFNKKEVSLFFKNLEEILDKYHFQGNRIFNTDETGISTVQKPGKILAKKGLKQVGFVTSWERGKNITVVCAFSASGLYVPPMFIYSRKRMNVLLQKGGPAGAFYACSDKGWITEDLFVQYLKHFGAFVKATKEDPVLLVMDNHTTHATLQAYEFCKENGIVLLTIPPHTSHRLQPLDVTFYSCLKTAFSSECNKYLKSHPHEKITPFEVAALFNQAYIRIATPEKAIRGFQITGICPYNPDVFTDEDFEAAQLHTNSSTVEIENTILENHQTSEPQSCPQPSEPTTSQSSSNLSLNISFEQILPVPCTSGVKKSDRNRSDKQHSQILTSTPNKEELQKKASKKKTSLKAKQICKRNLFGEQNESKNKLCKNEIGEQRKSKRVHNKIYEISSDEDHDDQDEDIELNGIDICLVCGEFGKNGEVWFRCVMCGNWAHKACADIERGTFICDYCK